MDEIPLTPKPEEATPPSVGEVMAIEVEGDGLERKLTRDPASVQAVVDALGASGTWKKGGMSRCRPALWARMVPPDGEGGATFLFCHADGPAYLYVPDDGSYVLPEEASRALYGVTSKLDLPESGSIAPVAVTENHSSVTVTASIALGSGAGQSLRSVSLSRGQRLEPDATWEDGSPVSRSFELTEEQSKSMVDALALSGFFHRAKKFHSPATEPPGDAPANSTEGPPPEPEAPAGWVQLTVTNGPWHHTWHEANASAIFESNLVSVKKAGSDEEISSALDSLSSQL